MVSAELVEELKRDLGGPLPVGWSGRARISQRPSGLATIVDESPEIGGETRIAGENLHIINDKVT